jgi:hypothetical protein
VDVSPARQANPGPLFSDLINLGNPASTQAHRSESQGTVRHERLHTEMGAIVGDHDVLTLSGTGATLSVVLNKPTGHTPLILEIEEIHQRRERAFGYMVAVDGRDTYFRTYQEIGAGPNHVFVAIPASQTGGDTVRVTIRSAGAPEFSLGRMWLYADFFNTTDQAEGFYRPLALNGRFTKPADGEPVMTSFAPLGDLILKHYANTPCATTRAAITTALDQSSATGRPVEILINGGTWGGAPSGPDGQGGYFNDGRYSLLSYDRLSDRYSPSYPNMWASTFWTTFRDPIMNDVLKRRFAGCMQGVSDHLAFLKASGKPAQPIFVRELGPPLGEITAVTVAAAARDGLILDPKDGLSQAERLWLYQDQVQLWRTYADWISAAIGRDSVTVDRGVVTLPNRQTSDDLYAHTIFRSEAPVNDLRWFGGQTGMVDPFWTTGECFWEMYAMYDYLRANGKLAHVNLEATILKNNGAPLRNLYGSGFQFVTFMNDDQFPDFTSVIRAVDGIGALPALPTPHHEPVIFSVHYGHLGSLGNPSALVSSENLMLHRRLRDNADAHGVTRLAVADCASPGQITYRLDNGGEAFVSGLSLNLDGRISPGSGNRLEILAGPTVESLRPVAVLGNAELPCPDHWEPYMTSKKTVALGEAMLGSTTWLVRVVIHAESAPDAAFLLSASVSTTWPRRSGYVEANPMTMRESRTLELMVQDRAVAGRQIRQYRALATNDDTLRTAEKLYAAGRYRSVQTLLSGALSEVLPARYTVRGHGTLGRHPLGVTLPGAEQMVLVTLLNLSDNGCEFMVASDTDRQPFRLTFPAGGRHTGWHLEQLATNHYRLSVRNGAGPSVPVHDDQVVVEREAVRAVPVPPALPRTLTARYLDGDASSIRVDTQDLAVMGFEDSLRLPLAAGVRVQRAPERLPVDGQAADKLTALDRVELKLDERGQVVAIQAQYGHDRGRIKVVHPPVFMGTVANGGIELENGNRYDFAYATHFDTVALQGRFCAYEAPMFAQALKPGQMVDIDYSPYAERGGNRRLIRVRQAHRVLLDQDFTSLTGDAWKTLTHAIDGVVVRPHRPEPNYLHHISMNLMRPLEHFTPGSVTYRIDAGKPLGATAVIFDARAYEDSSMVEFQVSIDGKAWTTCGRFDNTWQNSYPQSIDSKAWKNPPQFVDVSAAVAGQQAFFLKVVLRVHDADERFCLGSLRVVTEP